MNESNFLEASECCVDLKGQIYRDGDIDIDKLKGVPIAQQLCPLQVLLHTSTTGGLKRFGEFRYVKYELVNRCCGIFTNLKRIVIRVDKIYVTAEETCPAIGEFVHLVSKYQHFMQENLKKPLYLPLEDGGIMSIVSKAETNLLFKISQLEQWIDAKEAEMKMMEFIASSWEEGRRFGRSKSMDKSRQMFSCPDYPSVGQTKLSMP